MKKVIKRILFLQLPRLDNSIYDEEENIYLAGFYLSHSLERAEQGCAYVFRFLQPDEDALDDSHLVDVLIAWNPDVICATLCLWNVERSLSVLKRVKYAHPHVNIICGGPMQPLITLFFLKNRLQMYWLWGKGRVFCLRYLRRFSKEKGRTICRSRGRRTRDTGSAKIKILYLI